MVETSSIFFHLKHRIIHTATYDSFSFVSLYGTPYLITYVLGFVTVPSSEITSRNDVQVWLTLQPPVESSDRDLALFHLAAVGTIPIAHNPMDDTIRPDESSVLQSSNSFITLNGKQPFATVDHPDQSTMPQIRIRARYRSVDVLPHRDYWVLKAVS